MAGGFDTGEDEVIAGINMVPFIDICLVLLIVFMVTSSTIIRQAIEVELPQAASGGEVTATTVSVEVRRDGALRLNGEEITIGNLRDALETEVVENESVQAIIAGDRNADYGAVIDVVDIVKLSGVRSFALNIDRVAEP